MRWNFWELAGYPRQTSLSCVNQGRVKFNMLLLITCARKNRLCVWWGENMCTSVGVFIYMQNMLKVMWPGFAITCYTSVYIVCDQAYAFMYLVLFVWRKYRKLTVQLGVIGHSLDDRTRQYQVLSVLFCRMLMMEFITY